MSETNASDLPEKSLNELRRTFCDTWRRGVTDEQFLDLMQEAVLGNDYGALDKPSPRLSYLLRFFRLKVGDSYYEVNTDTEFRLTE